MIVLIVLIAAFVISIISLKIIRGRYEFALAARIGMSVMLLFTAIGHFVFTKGMAMMLPEFIPYRNGIIYVTGIIEIIAAITLLTPSLRTPTGWFLIVFFIVLLPSNVYAAVNHIDLENATATGSGPGYLWFRVPLQLLFIAWTYFAAIKI